MAAKETITFQLNGSSCSTDVFPMSRLLDVLRAQAGVTGTKEGCGEGECGACSVFVNGRLVNSCLVPVGEVAGADIETIEGTPNNEVLDTVKKSFLKRGGAQCGICTPGMILAAVDLLKSNPNPDLEEVKHHLGGNLCRCTGYMKIFDSVLDAARELGGRS